MGTLDDLLGRRVYFDTNVFIYALNGFPAYAGFLKGLTGNSAQRIRPQ